MSFPDTTGTTSVATTAAAAVEADGAGEAATDAFAERLESERAGSSSD